MSIAYGIGDLGIGLGSYLWGWMGQIWGYQIMSGSVEAICLLRVAVFALLTNGARYTGVLMQSRSCGQVDHWSLLPRLSD